ncbi:DUF7537 family lipoprotein [Halomarina rubra]|uniref:Outer membrane lipoprotein-sorting protein n=1 Tax=Halomarina rubra TaxID=2071873 RepID=A0ABD6AYG0_9EURY|nr:hypothetical protein [Halomarina rubra]
MRRWSVVVLAVVVVLAGCGATPGGREDAERPATVTPAAVPTEPPTPTPVPVVVPGVTADGEVSAVALAAGHRDALVGDSFTRSATRTISEAGTLVRRTERRYRVEPFRPEFRYHQNQTIAGSYPARAAVARLDLWSNGSGVVARLEDDDEVRYQQAPADEFSSLVVGITGDERVSALGGAFSFVVRDGPTADTVRLVSTGLRTPAALDEPPLTTDVRNASLTMVVTRAGLVRSYRLTYDVTLDERTLRVVESMRITAVGDTQVERPSWYRFAVENGSQPPERTGPNGSRGRYVPSP